MFTKEIIAQAIFMYLRALSLNSVADIFRSWYDNNIFTKATLIKHIEKYSNEIPEQLEITKWLKPTRSGYYALDGTWLKYRGRDIVLLILFDVKTLDIINWKVSLEENFNSYSELIEPVLSEISFNIKGFHCDGDKGLLRALAKFFPKVPVQLCVFHKYSRAGQIIPFVRVKNDVDKTIKKLTEQVLFSKTKQEAISSLNKLERYAEEHQQHKKLQKLIGALQCNFNLLLTHFDNPEMSPYNNVLEGFNYMIKRRTRLMKGFKKPVNINKWLKLILTDWRFHSLKESEFTSRRNKSPLELAGCKLPKIYNWIKYVDKNFEKNS